MEVLGIEPRSIEIFVPVSPSTGADLMSLGEEGDAALSLACPTYT